MKEGWEYKELGAICKTSAGGTPLKTEKEYYENGNIPWLMSGEVCSKYIFNAEKHITQKGVENSSAKLFPKDTVVVAMYGATAGQVSILKFETTTNQAVCGIFPNKELLPEFLYYFFLFYKEALVAQAVGNAQPNISQQKIKKTLIPILSIAEQERIVSILDKAFEKIDAIKANAEENLANAKALFQAALKKELTPKEGWEEKKLGDVADIVHGKNQKQVVAQSGKFPIYGSGGNIMGYASDYICPEGTTILGRKGSINNPQFISTKFWNVDTAFGIVPKEGTYNKFLYYTIKNINWMELNTGTTLPSLTQKVVNSVKVLIPSYTTQKSIANKLDNLVSACTEMDTNLLKVSCECDALKQAILRKAFNGEL